MPTRLSIDELYGGNWEYFAPEYSPDGRWIPFDGTRGGLQTAIWVIGTDGTGPRRAGEARGIPAQVVPPTANS